MESAGETIRALRIAAGLTQGVLADLWHCTRERISRIETGAIQITADEYLELVWFLKDVKRVASFKINYHRKEFA